MFRKRLKALTVFHPVIFPNNLVHADVASDMLAGSLKGYKADSAGSINLGFGIIQCYGESTTLGLKARPERDERIIKMNDYGGGLK